MTRGGLARALLLVGFSLTAGRVAHAAGPPPGMGAPLLASTPNQPLTFTVGTKVRVADVTDDTMRDGDITLRRSPGRLRGHVGTQSIEVQLEPGRVAGTLGDQPVGLDVFRAGPSLQVAGTFGGRSVAMQIRHDAIEAQVGPCTYRLGLSLGHYRGFVTCGGAPASVDLTVPVALVARDDRELALMLTTLFAR